MKKREEPVLPPDFGTELGGPDIDGMLRYVTTKQAFDAGYAKALAWCVRRLRSAGKKAGAGSYERAFALDLAAKWAARETERT